MPESSGDTAAAQDLAAAALAEVDSRIAAIGKLVEQIGTLTAQVVSPSGTVRAVAVLGQGVGALDIRPDAYEVEGERLTGLVRETVNAALAEVSRNGIGMLNEVHDHVHALTEMFGPDSVLAEASGNARQWDELRRSWEEYRKVVDDLRSRLSRNDH